MSTARARAAGTIHRPGRTRAAITSAAMAAAVTPTVIRCSADRSTSAGDRHFLRELAHLVEPLGDQGETALQPAVEGGAAEVQPLHDHLMAADLLDVVIEQQVA